MGLRKAVLAYLRSEIRRQQVGEAVHSLRQFTTDELIAIQPIAAAETGDPELVRLARSIRLEIERRNAEAKT